MLDRSIRVVKYACSKGIIMLYKLRYGRKLFIGGGLAFRKRFNLNLSTNEARVSIGKGCFFNNNCSINARLSISIGEDCLLGENVCVYDHNHVFEQLKLKTKEQGFECSPVVIGDNCWIGSNVIILKGVSIGNNSVIGAGTVIAKNIPPNSVVIDRQDLVIKSRAVVEGNQ